MKACPMYVERAHTHAAVEAVSAVAAAEQQPEGWRFVLDTILPGYQWAPDQREGRGWPEHSLAQQHSAETRQTWQRSLSRTRARTLVTTALLTRVCCVIMGQKK